MVESPAEVSANELRQLIGGSYKTAWFATHRVRAAMRGSGAEILQSVIRAEHEEQTATLGAIDQFREDSAEAPQMPSGRPCVSECGGSSPGTPTIT